MTRYIHLREHDGRHLAPKGGATIAYDPADRVAGVAVCSRRDQYNKKLGRAIAEGRMRKAMNLKADVDAAAVLGPGNSSGPVGKHLKRWAKVVMPLLGEKLEVANG